MPESSEIKVFRKVLRIEATVVIELTVPEPLDTTKIDLDTTIKQCMAAGRYAIEKPALKSIHQIVEL